MDEISAEELAVLDPTVRCIQREVSDAMNRTGMKAGLPKVRLDASKVQRLIDLYLAALSRAETAEEKVGAELAEQDRKHNLIVNRLSERHAKQIEQLRTRAALAQTKEQD